MGPLEKRVKDGMPICVVCGKRIFSPKRMSREFHVVGTRVEVVYRHRPKLCKPDYFYVEDR